MDNRGVAVHAGATPDQVSPARQDRWPAMLAGVAASSLGLAAGELVAVVVNPTAAPLTAVGDAFIDIVPARVKDVAIAVFGVFDKLALVVGMLLVIAAIGAAIGVLGRRSRLLASGTFAALAAVAAVIAQTRPGAGANDWTPAAACAVVAIIALRALLRRLPSDEPDPVVAESSRRRFLQLAWVSTAVGVVGGAGARWLTGRSGAADEVRAAVHLPAPAVTAPAPPPGVDPAVPGLTTYRTANPDFYRIDTALAVPRVDPATWKLRVYGMVEREVELTLADLLGDDLVEAWVTLACVSNPVGGDLVGNALWSGLPIRDVLAKAAPTAGADMVLSRSIDGWSASTPLEVLSDPARDCLLAVSMNGEPLPLEHGFPVRMVVPGLYGYVSATKWVTELEVTTFAGRTAYWTTRGWAPRGPVKTASRIDVPAPGAAVTAGETTVAGVAWAQHRGIDKVEVQVDDGPWQLATLAPTVGPDTWRQWTFPWTATAGRHTLRVRATDTTGQTQTSARAQPTPDGATGWHTVEVDVG